MSELPIAIPINAPWPALRIDKLCSIVSRGAAPTYVERSDVLAIGQRCVKETGFDASVARPLSTSARNTLFAEPGDVLLNSTGTGTIGRSCVFEELGKFAGDTHVTLLRPIGEKLNGYWLDSMLRSPWGQRHLERFCYSGSTNQVELHRSQLASTQIPVPSLDEQAAFRSVLATLDSTIRQTEAIIEKLKQVKQGLLHDLLTRGIDANGELRPPQSEAPRLYKESPLGWIPTGWVIRRFREIGRAPQLGLTVRGASSIGTNVGLLKMGNLLEGNQLNLGYLEPVDVEKVDRLDEYTLADGDLLFNTRNTPELVGKTCSWRECADVTVFDNNILRMRVAPSIGNGHFVASYMGSLSGRARLLRLATGTTSVAAIYWKYLGDFALPLPAPSEQDQIVERLVCCDERVTREQLLVSSLSALKAGLIDDLLTGRVRVTQLLSQAATL